MQFFISSLILGLEESDEYAYLLWGTQSLVVKDMIELKLFSLKSLVKGSYTVVEFRVSLEKKKTDGKVFIVHKKYSRDSAFTKTPSHSTQRKLL